MLTSAAATVLITELITNQPASIQTIFTYEQQQGKIIIKKAQHSLCF